MSGPLDFTNENIENTYQRVLQTDGTYIYDGTGSLFPITASYTLSSSYALTASYTPDALVTGSVNSNILTFTKGDGSSFNLTIDTGSGGTSTDTGSLLVTASANLNEITFTKGDGSTFPIVIDTGSSTPIDTSSFVTTSSFNNFTSSFNSFTSSYNTGSFSGSFTGSIFGTSSYYQETDPVFVAKSASLATTGSNIFIGNQTVTGSLFTTGSNTLVGNTILSGTLQIQGQYPPSVGSESVSIVGNVDLNGYLRFDPVTSNIDTSISASYIYVSGSTQDLYFSQNGSGYANVTRLRWLEGNLYTGLLHGGALSQVNSNTYRVASGSGIIVDLNASLNDDPYPTIQFLEWGNLTKTIDALSSSFDQQFIAISSSNQIHAKGTPYFNGEVDTYIPIGIVLHQNRTSINGVKTQPSLAYGWKQRSNIFISAFGPLKISGHALLTSSSLGLTVGSGTSFSDGANYPTDPNNPSYVTDPGTNVSKIFRYRQSGSGWVYDTNAGVGYTTIDPTQYSLNGTLTGVANNRWSIQRVFWYPNSVSKAIVVYYGNAVYSNESEAIANINIETFSEAPNTAANAIYLGAIVIKGDGTFAVAADFTILPGGLFRGVGGGGGGGGGTTTPGGSNTQIQYNNNGAFGGVPNLTWDGTTLFATGSFTGSFTGELIGTSSWATNALTSSFITASNVYGPYGSNSVLSSSYAISSSYSLLSGYAESASYSISSSYSLSSSYSVSSSYTLSSSYSLSSSYAESASYTLSSSYSLSSSYVESSSYSLSGSYALTASYALNAVPTDTGSLLTTASISSNIITLTKGDGSTFPLVLNNDSTRVLLLSQSVSSSSTIEFVNLFTNDYTRYEVEIDDALPQVAGAIKMEIGTGSTPTWQTGGTAYGWVSTRVLNTGTGTSPLTFNQTDGQDRAITLLLNFANLAVENSFSGTIVIYNPLQDFAYHQFTFILSETQNPIQQLYNGKGTYWATTPVTSVRFYSATGNLLRGNFRLYGYK